MPQAGVSAEVKSVGEQFTDTDAYKNYMSNGVKGVDSKVETKTSLTTTGYPPEVLRQPGILETALRDPNAVISLFDVINSDQNAFSYLEETTFTNNAAEAAEGAAVGEAALAFTEQTEAIRKMGIFIPVTDELLADESGIQGYLNSRLQTMIRLRMDSQLLSGDGTAPNLEGILDAGKTSVGSTDFSSYAGTLGKIGAIYGAITDIRVNAFTEPDAIIMHPNDWNDVVTAVGADFRRYRFSRLCRKVTTFRSSWWNGRRSFSTNLGTKSLFLQPQLPQVQYLLVNSVVAKQLMLL